MEKRGLILKWGEVLKLLQEKRLRLKLMRLKLSQLKLPQLKLLRLRWFQEGASFAFSHLVADRFRTLLSLLGVSVGIFSIVAILSAVDALKENMKRGLSTFGSDVVSISKWPYSGEDEYGNTDNYAEYRWWEYARRPAPSLYDYKFLKSKSTTASAVVMEMLFFKGVEHGRNSISDCDIKAVTYDWNRIVECNLQQGRYFTGEEADRGVPVCIIGYKVWQELFCSDDTVFGIADAVIGSANAVIGSVDTEIGSDDTVFGSANAEIGSDDTVIGSADVERGAGSERASYSRECLDSDYAIGRKIKVGGKALIVIGVCSKQGESMLDIGGNTDLSVIIPLEVGRRMESPNKADISIYARPREGVGQQEFCDELMVLMRSCRRLSPTDRNNFSINKMSFLLEVVEGILAMVNSVGWIIAGFSLLAGGFGIANIMFVSVKERTNIIGIQKALGAKRHVILAQFLIESLLLCIAGGLAGILLAWGVLLAIEALPSMALKVLPAMEAHLSWVADMLIPCSGMFEMQLSGQNIIIALVVSCVIGVLSGLAPAISAAAMSPADAINSK